MTAIGLFFTGWLLTWPALAILCFLAILFESADSGWSTFTVIVTAIIAFFYFDITLLTFAIWAGGYFLLGFVWSFWRYNRWVDQQVAEAKDLVLSERQRAFDRMRPSNMVSKLTQWVIVWPFSLIESFVGDFIATVQRFITTVFKGVYNKIHLSAGKRLGL